MQSTPQGRQSFPELDPNSWISFRDGKLTQHEPSPYAWMSIRDGESMKALLVNAAAARRGEPLRVLEWGAGKSTFSFTDILREAEMPYRWLALEYDRQFCDATIAPELLRRPDTLLRYIEDGRVVTGAAVGEPAIEVVCWNSPPLRPFMGADHRADRSANLDAYVDYPMSTGRQFDVIIVDGRKRRRCLLAALDLMAEGGIVLLHDAYRDYYHCATDAYAVARFFGDALWIGAADEAALEAVVGASEA